MSPNRFYPQSHNLPNNCATDGSEREKKNKKKSRHTKKKRSERWKSSIGRLSDTNTLGVNGWNEKHKSHIKHKHTHTIAESVLGVMAKFNLIFLLLDSATGQPIIERVQLTQPAFVLLFVSRPHRQTNRTNDRAPNSKKEKKAQAKNCAYTTSKLECAGWLTREFIRLLYHMKSHTTQTFAKCSVQIYIHILFRFANTIRNTKNIWLKLAWHKNQLPMISA